MNHRDASITLCDKAFPGLNNSPELLKVQYRTVTEPFENTSRNSVGKELHRILIPRVSW